MGRNDDNGNTMNKVLISLAVLATVTTSPAYAISASYRAQLERSGCTQESELRGCDVTKTKAQNSARGFKLETAIQEATRRYAPFVGSYGVFMPNGQRINQLVVKKDGAVLLNGHKAKEHFVTAEDLNVFEDGLHIILKTDKKGSWRNSNTNESGSVGK